VNVFRQIHLPHSSDADLIENTVWTQAETSVFALEYEAGLELREDARSHEPCRRVVCAGGQRAGLLEKDFQNIIVCQFAPANQFQNSITRARRFGHDETYLERREI
jgi:hypothetical protein